MNNDIGTEIANSLLFMQTHETRAFKINSEEVNVTRVMSGWIYCKANADHNTIGIFVPYSEMHYPSSIPASIMEQINPPS